MWVADEAVFARGRALLELAAHADRFRATVRIPRLTDIVEDVDDSFFHVLTLTGSLMNFHFVKIPSRPPKCRFKGLSVEKVCNHLFGTKALLGSTWDDE